MTTATPPPLPTADRGSQKPGRRLPTPSRGLYPACLILLGPCVMCLASGVLQRIPPPLYMSVSVADWESVRQCSFVGQRSLAGILSESWQPPTASCGLQS
eukprot:EG_transcript_25062